MNPNILLFILMLIILIGAAMLGFAVDYFSHKAKAFTGCAKDYCSQSIIDEYYARGGEDKGYWNDWFEAGLK